MAVLGTLGGIAAGGVVEYWRARWTRRWTVEDRLHEDASAREQRLFDHKRTLYEDLLREIRRRVERLLAYDYGASPEPTNEELRKFEDSLQVIKIYGSPRVNEAISELLERMFDFVKDEVALKNEVAAQGWDDYSHFPDYGKHQRRVDEARKEVVAAMREDLAIAD